MNKLRYDVFAISGAPSRRMFVNMLKSMKEKLRSNRNLSGVGVTYEIVENDLKRGMTILLVTHFPKYANNAVYEKKKLAHIQELFRKEVRKVSDIYDYLGEIEVDDVEPWVEVEIAPEDIDADRRTYERLFLEREVGMLEKFQIQVTRRIERFFYTHPNTAHSVIAEFGDYNEIKVYPKFRSAHRLAALTLSRSSTATLHSIEDKDKEGCALAKRSIGEIKDIYHSVRREVQKSMRRNIGKRTKYTMLEGGIAIKAEREIESEATTRPPLLLSTKELKEFIQSDIYGRMKPLDIAIDRSTTFIGGKGDMAEETTFAVRYKVKVLDTFKSNKTDNIDEKFSFEAYELFERAFMEFVQDWWVKSEEVDLVLVTSLDDTPAKVTRKGGALSGTR